MKKVGLILLGCLMLTGCTAVRIDTQNIDNMVSVILSKDNDLYNHVGKGYKNYVPRGVTYIDTNEFNEKLYSNGNYYYLYVDAVSYLNQVDYKYEENSENIYSTSISNGEYFGYVEINLTENDKYLVEIMYNYAKIEVIVDEGDINRAMLSAISILKSIVYNDSIITNLLEDNVLDFAEEEFDIFNNNSNDDDYIDVGTDDFQPIEEEIPDSDLLN